MRCFMCLAYNQYTLDEQLVGIEASAYHAIDEAYPRPTVFFRDAIVKHLVDKLDITPARALSAYNRLRDKALIEMAGVTILAAREHQLRGNGVHEIDCDCFLCLREFA